MKKQSASSQSAARVTSKRRSTLKGRKRTARPAMIAAKEFDRRADLQPDDPEGDLTPYMDLARARRPGREIQRVNVDFPVALLEAIDREATRIGVTRQAFIKLRLADMIAMK
jgi:hypothetical protein